MILRRRDPTLDTIEEFLGGDLCQFEYAKHRCYGKGGGSGGGTTSVNNSTAPPPEVMAAYQTALNSAQLAASQPLQQYNAPVVAGFSPDQVTAFGNVANAQNVQTPYINAAQTAMQAGQAPLWNNVQQFSPSAISNYASPYTSSVLNSAVAQQQNTDAMQQQALKGNAISSGAWGGDRAGVASAILSGQQDLANNSTNANILNTGYNTALGEFNTQQQAQLGANEANAYLNEQAGFGLAGLGTEAQNTALEGANAQEAAGALQQQLSQAQLNIPYQQFLQAQAYPFQTAQYFSNVAEGIGSNSGGVGTSSTTTPAPSTLSQVGGIGIGGLGVAGLSGVFGAKQGGRVKGFGAGGHVPRYAAGGLTYGVPDMSVDFIPGNAPVMGHGPPQASSSSMTRSSNGQGGGLSATDLLGLGKAVKGISGLFDSGAAGGLSSALDPGASALAGVTNPLDMFNLAGGASEGAAGWGFGLDSALATSEGLDVAGTAAAATADAGFWSSVGDALMAIFAFNRGGAVPSKAFGGQRKTKGFDAGGMVGGQTPMTAGMPTASPQTQTYDNSYSNMAPEQLQQIIARLPAGSPQQKAAQTVLQQKQMMPNVGVQARGGLGQIQTQIQNPIAQGQLPQQDMMQGGLARGGRTYGGGGGVVHSNSWMNVPGQYIGAGIGSFFGGPLGGAAGSLAGENAGATIGDLTAGNIKGLGLDVSQNLPPGFQDPGIGGLVNGATGLPLGNVFGFARGGRAQRFAPGGDVPGIFINSPPPNQDQLQRAMELGDLPGIGNIAADGADVQRVPLQDLAPPGATMRSGMGPPQPGSAPLADTPAQDPASAMKTAAGIALTGKNDGANPDVSDNADTDASDYSGEEPPNSRAPSKPNPWLALAQAGFAMAGGTSPYAGVNIGRGMEAGLQNYEKQQKESDTVNQAADKLMAEAKQHKDTLALDQQKADETERHNQVLEGQGKYSISRDPLTGAVDLVNTKTGEVKRGPSAFDAPAGSAAGAPPGGATPIQPSLANVYKAPLGADGQPVTGEDYLPYLPAPIANLTKRIGDGDYQVTPYTKARDPKVALAEQAAFLYDHSYNDRRYAEIQRFDMDPSKGDTTRRFNVVGGHVQMLTPLIDALETGDQKQINEAAQAVQTNFGLSAAPNNLDAAKQLIGNEIVRATTGEAGALEDRKAVQERLDAATSPKLLKSVVDNVYKPAIRQQLIGLEKQYQAGTGLQNYRQKYLLPQTVQGLGLNPTPNQKAIDALQGDPKKRKEFEHYYGISADPYLGRQ